MTAESPALDPGERLFVVVCPACTCEVAASTGLANRPVRCPLCTAAFRVPQPELPAAAAPDAPPPAAVTATPAGHAAPAETGASAAAAPAGSAVEAATPAAEQAAVPAPARAATDSPSAAPPAAGGASETSAAPAATTPGADPGAVRGEQASPGSTALETVPERPAGPDLTALSASLAAATASGTAPAMPGLGIAADAAEHLRQAERERIRRRARRNLITLLVGAAILIGIALGFGAPRDRRSRRP